MATAKYWVAIVIYLSRKFLLIYSLQHNSIPNSIARTHKYFNEPTFNQWLYNILINLTPVQKDLLTNNELHRIRNKEAMSFINSATQDRIDILLTKVGCRVARVYYAPDKLNVQIIQETHKLQNILNKPAEAIEEVFR